jgi:hypothetical protein
VLKIELGMGHVINKLNGAFLHFNENYNIATIQQGNDKSIAYKLNELYPDIKLNNQLTKQQDQFVDFFKNSGLTKKEQ